METGGLDPHTVECIQIAAVVINPRTLDFYRDSRGEPVYFESLLRPLYPEKLEAGALRVNNKKVEDLMKAPTPDVVWARFAAFVKQYNLGGKTTGYNLPIAAGHNIIGYDNIILERYCQAYGCVRDRQKGDERQAIFNDRITYDTLHIAALWFEGRKEPSSYSLDSLREYFGISKVGAHDALKDVIDCGLILSRFLSLHRKVKVKFKDSFKPQVEELGARS